MNTLDVLDAQSQRTDIPDFRAGDTLKVYARVVEGNRSRVQVFQGVVIRRHGAGLRETFTIRKVSFGVGVERTYRSTARRSTGLRSSPVVPSGGRSSTTSVTSVARPRRSRRSARRFPTDVPRTGKPSLAPRAAVAPNAT